MIPSRRFVLTTALAAVAAVAAILGAAAETPGSSQRLRLPNSEKSFKFAVIGDTGTGGSAQRRVADRMAKLQSQFPFELVIMVGDNMYGGEKAPDFRKKFEEPYAELLRRKVKFYAALGNHDEPSQRKYELFNMGGERYYTFRPVKNVRFFALDSSYIDQEQMDWLEKQMRQSESKWKIPFFHHPLYSSAERHGSELELRKALEPIFQRTGVDVVFSGHDHVYERIKPQHEISYFVVGNSAKLREGDLARTPITAVGFDEGYAFLMCEIEGDTLYFQAISDRGNTIDSGQVRAREDRPKAVLSRAGAQQ
jgi:predicted MPP superfamily phosphohydrolase